MAWYRNGMYLHEYRLVIHLSSSSVDICYPLRFEVSCHQIWLSWFSKGTLSVESGGKKQSQRIGAENP